jgi:hypothetical protein
MSTILAPILPPAPVTTAFNIGSPSLICKKYFYGTSPDELDKYLIRNNLLPKTAENYF